MKIPYGKCAFVSCILALSSLGGCNSREPGRAAAIANPASEHCIKRGGRLEIVKDASGEKGICHLPDGTAVEEWELFRRDNPRK